MISQFQNLCGVDVEYIQRPGERPDPVCLVFKELHSGKTVKLWRDELGTSPPYPVDESSLFYSYNAVAELSCHAALGWSMPVRIVDLYAEYRLLTNDFVAKPPASLLDAMRTYGLSSMSHIEKQDMRNLILGGGPWPVAMQQAILAYCESDVIALEQLFLKMLPHIDLPRALLRGRYQAAAAQIEHNGIPIDGEMSRRLKSDWGTTLKRLIKTIDEDYGVFEEGSLRRQKLEDWAQSRGIEWHRTESGQLATDKDTLKTLASIHPELKPFYDLMVILRSLPKFSLAVGDDGRNRTGLMPFSARTSRNQPKSSESVFGPSTAIRGLIKPSQGQGIAYLDWEQQELGIAAALSKDTKMMAAYLSGDPYLEFGKQAGLIPQHATKASHRKDRDRFKTCSLGVLYGMTEWGLANRLGISEIEARDLIGVHKLTYPDFWKFSDNVVRYGLLHGRLTTVFGWSARITSPPKEAALRNFLMQANAAEMLRIACCLTVEAGLKVCMPVHDAILIEASLERLDEDVQRAQALMAEASRVLLDGFELRTEAKVVCYPDRYMDERGIELWNRLMKLIEGQEK